MPKNEPAALPTSYDLIKYIRATILTTGIKYVWLNTAGFIFCTLTTLLIIAVIHGTFYATAYASSWRWWALPMVLVWFFGVRNYPRFWWIYTMNARRAVKLARVERDRECERYSVDIPVPSVIACMRSRNHAEYAIDYIDRVPAMVNRARRIARATLRQESQPDARPDPVEVTVTPSIPCTEERAGIGCEERLLTRIRTARPYLVSDVALRVDQHLEAYEALVKQGEHRLKKRLYLLWRIVDILETPEAQKMLRQAPQVLQEA